MAYLGKTFLGPGTGYLAKVAGLMILPLPIVGGVVCWCLKKALNPPMWIAIFSILYNFLVATARATVNVARGALKMPKLLKPTAKEVLSFMEEI